MSSISDAQLVQAGLLSDEILGFRAAMRGRVAREPSHVDMPEHFQEERNLPRRREFERGARIGLNWRQMRTGAASARRAERARDFRDLGIAYAIDPDAVKAEAASLLLQAVAQADLFIRPDAHLVEEIRCGVDPDRSWWDMEQAASYYGPDDRNGILSPIRPTLLRAMGERGWRSMEAIYHAQKFPHDLAMQDAIRDAPDAVAAKAIAREHRQARRRNWSNHRVVAMTRVVVLRTEQDDVYRSYLSSLGGRDIVEDTTQGEHNRFWGVVDGLGTNVAGQIAMVVRDRLLAGDSRLSLE